MIDTTKEYRNKVAVRLFEIMKNHDNVLTNSQIYSLIAEDLKLTEEDKKIKFKSGAYVYQNHTQFGLLGLKVMGLVSHVSRGKWVITQSGKEKAELDIDEYSNFQKKHWNTETSKKRKVGVNKNTSFQQKNLFGGNLSETKKEEMLSKILEQNKRILDYIMGEK